MPKQTGKIKLDGVFAERKAIAPERHVLLPGGWWLWCLLGLAVGLGAWIGSRQYLRAQLANQLTSTQSEQVALQSIEALLRLDGDATIEVSRSLAHPEFMVANAAFRALSGQLDAWGRLDAPERLRRMMQIVTELERTPESLDQDHRILINGLASRIYAETLSNRQPGAAELLSSCKRIMARGQPRATTALATQTSEAMPATDGSSSTSALGNNSPGEQQSDNPVPPPLPPLRSTGKHTFSPNLTLTSPQQASARLSDTPPALKPNGMPRMTSTTAEPVALSSGRATVQLTASPARQAAASEAPTRISLSDLPNDNGVQHGNSLTDSVSEHDSETLAGIEALPIDQLVRLLSSLQPRVAQAATLALRRKGMSDDKLALAMNLANGTSSERLELLQSLAARKDLDPRPWLLWMAGDGDDKVREQAVGLLSPLLDNDVRRQLRMLLNQERDERVAQTIRRVLVQ